MVTMVYTVRIEHHRLRSIPSRRRRDMAAVAAAAQGGAFGGHAHTGGVLPHAQLLGGKVFGAALGVAGERAAAEFRRRCWQRPRLGLLWSVDFIVFSFLLLFYHLCIYYQLSLLSLSYYTIIIRTLMFFTSIFFWLLTDPILPYIDRPQHTSCVP